MSDLIDMVRKKMCEDDQIRSILSLVIKDIATELVNMRARYPEFIGISWDAAIQELGDYARKKGI